jgi:hypothetical protein
MPDYFGGASDEYRSWQCPPAAASESQIISWCDDATGEGQSWLRSQRGYGDMKRALDIISGRDTSTHRTADYRSHVSTNRLKRNIRETVGALAKLRPMWGYHSDNTSYKDQAEMMNKVTKAWYLESFADRKVKEALAYAAVTCRGWLHPVYRRAMFGTGKGEITLLTYGAPCVLPVQLPSSGDYQSAYAVTILDEMPVAMAHGMFPAFQHRLRPSSSRYWYVNDDVRAASGGNILQRMFGNAKPRASSPGMSDLLVPMRKTYVIDLTINTTKAAIPMGEPGSSWSYTVPFVGQQIPAGVDLKSGSKLFRVADENDARLYPYRRLILSTDKVKLYDGPSFDWHGMFPGISFGVDEWPWEPLGFSMAHDGHELQSAINELARGNMDKARAQLDPGLAYDTNAVSSSEAKRYDPMQPRARVGYDGSAVDGKPFQETISPEILKISPESMALWEKFENVLDHQQGIADIQTLTKMRAVGSMDDLEKIMEANGPIVEDQSRSMEPPMRDLGIMIKYLILQYYTTSRVMQWVGPDGITPEVFDYNPATLVPSHMPGEPIDKMDSSGQRISIPSEASTIQRARTFADNLRFFIMPNSLHEMQQMSMKLGLIQLKKAGVQIDSQTIAEAWNIPNYGSIPGNTVRERFASEQEEMLQFAARMEAMKAALSGDVGGGGGAPGQPPGAVGPGKPNPEGRPATNAAPFALKSKDGNTRSTITSSK